MMLSFLLCRFAVQVQQPKIGLMRVKRFILSISCMQLDTIRYGSLSFYIDEYYLFFDVNSC